MWTAAAHQLGETAVELIAEIHDLALPDVIYALAAHARRRQPRRWTWLPG